MVSEMSAQFIERAAHSCRVSTPIDCASSLTNSFRRTLVTFLRNDLPSHLRDQNRRLALDFLRSLSARNLTSHDETLILTWGQVAMFVSALATVVYRADRYSVCGQRELNLALLRLVDYLGHPNSLVCSLAFSEVCNHTKFPHERIIDLQ